MFSYVVLMQKKTREMLQPSYENSSISNVVLKYKICDE
jgi:hypothetical protein